MVVTVILAAWASIARAEPLPLPEVALSIEVETALRKHAEAATTSRTNDLDRLLDDRNTQCVTRYEGAAYAAAVVPCVELVQLVDRRMSDREGALGEAVRTLAAVLEAAGRYREAERLLRWSLQANERSRASEHLDLQSLAGLLLATGRPREAEAKYRRALALAKQAYGPDHIVIAGIWNNLAGLLNQTGRPAEAEPLFRRSLALVEATFGPDHPNVAALLNNLGGVLQATGRHREAEPMYRRAYAVTRASLGPHHPHLATVAVNLGGVLDDLRQFDEAEERYREALGVAEFALGRDHPTTAAVSTFLADSLRFRDRHREAEAIYRRAISTHEAASGAQHPDVSLNLNNLALSLEAMGRTDEAEAAWRRALAIDEAVWGPDHPHVARELFNLALLLEGAGRRDEVLPVLQRALAVEESDLRRNLIAGAPGDRRARFAKLSTTSWNVVSWHLQRNPDRPDAAALALTTWLRRKGRLAAIERDLLVTIRAAGDPSAVALLEDIQVTTAELAALRSRGPGAEGEEAWRGVIDARSRDLAARQRQLAETSPAARQALREVEMANVAEQLPKGARLVEVVPYRPFDLTQGWGGARYALYGLDAEGTVSWADLGEQEAIDRQVSDLRDAMLARRPVGALARTLHAATLGRLDLGGATHLFLSTDGQLGLVPFALLLDGNPDGPTVSYLGSGRELLAEVGSPPSRQPSLVVSDVDYDAGVNGPSGRWRPLVHTRPEGRAVRRALGRAEHLTGASATEAAIRAAARPTVLHVASHGYIDAASESPESIGLGALRDVRPGEAAGLRPRDVETAHPMLRSGIVLAGANGPGTGNDDGLLTAGEVAGLDLRGTKLATLSACSTGDGELRSGDGVYGLRRALVLAGARAQVLSLWSVDDAATAYFMRRFYQALGKGRTAREALAVAQKAVRDRPKWAHPVYWAAFTLSGDPFTTLR